MSVSNHIIVYLTIMSHNLTLRKIAIWMSKNCLFFSKILPKAIFWGKKDNFWAFLMQFFDIQVPGNSGLDWTGMFVLATDRASRRQTGQTWSKHLQDWLKLVQIWHTFGKKLKYFWSKYDSPEFGLDFIYMTQPSDVNLPSNVGQIGPQWNKSGTF